MPELLLPIDGHLVAHTIARSCAYKCPLAPLQSRIAYAAAHVVADPVSKEIDWESTMADRLYLWDWGLGVAEIMDGLSWNSAQDLIARTLTEAKAANGLVACGADTHQLPEAKEFTVDQIAEAYEEQCGFIEKHGGRVILMPSAALARTAKSPDDYAQVYARILQQLNQPAILQWSCDVFDSKTTETWLGIIVDNAGQIDGVNICLLDKECEEDMRRLLPVGVRMYTADEFHYDELIGGDRTHHSDALLGIFDGIAPAASAAIQALDCGKRDEFNAILAPTLALARHIFQSPVDLKNTGIQFLAWLTGRQKHFHSVRSISYFAKLLVLAEDAGVLLDPDLACHRMSLLLETAGVQ